MLTNKKYKTDKILKPILIVLGILPFVAYYTAHKGLAIVAITVLFTTLLGVSIFRCIKEGNKKDALMYSVIFLVILIIIAFSIKVTL